MNDVSIDTIAATALLIIRDLANVEITRYTYSNAALTVQLEPRLVVTTVTVPQLNVNLNDIDLWKSLIERTWGSVPVGRGDTSEDVNNNPGNVRTVFKVNAVLVSDFKYLDSTQTIAFQPRPLMVLTWTEFLMWFRFLRFASTKFHVGI
jgi:hypothetical protein